MFTINGNLTGFTQYEQGYSLTNPNMKAGDMVCFASGSGESARAMAKEVEGVVLVEVPNILLGYTANVTATFEDGSDYTSFTVAPAPVPEGGWKPTFNEYKVGDAKVIDGTVCDEDGNAVVSGGGGASSWNELTDRPFGEETVMGDTLTWDGNTEGLVSAEADGVAFYKLSDNVITLEDCSNGLIIVMGGESIGLTAEELAGIQTETGVFGTESFLVAPTDNYEVELVGVVLPEKGIYFAQVEGIFVESLTINGYTGFETTETKQLDNKYLEPFETVGGDTLTWDGNTEGLEVIAPTGTPWYKVADNLITLNDLSQGFSVTVGGQTAEIPAEAMSDAGGAIVFDAGAFVYDSAIAEELNASTGVYLMEGISSLTINGYTGFEKTALKEEYIPLNVRMVITATESNVATVDGKTVITGQDYTAIMEHVSKGGSLVLNLLGDYMYPIIIVPSDNYVSAYTCGIEANISQVILAASAEDIT